MNHVFSKSMLVVVVGLGFGGQVMPMLSTSAKELGLKKTSYAPGQGHVQRGDIRQAKVTGNQSPVMQPDKSAGKATSKSNQLVSSSGCASPAFKNEHQRWFHPQGASAGMRTRLSSDDISRARDEYEAGEADAAAEMASDSCDDTDTDECEGSSDDASDTFDNEEDYYYLVLEFVKKELYRLKHECPQVKKYVGLVCYCNAIPNKQIGMLLLAFVRTDKLGSDDSDALMELHQEITGLIHACRSDNAADDAADDGAYAGPDVRNGKLRKNNRARGSDRRETAEQFMQDVAPNPWWLYQK